MKLKFNSQVLNISIGYYTRRQTSTTQGYESWSHCMTNVSFSEMNILINISVLVMSLPISLSIKLSFVSINGTRETYFVDELRSNGIRNLIGDNFVKKLRRKRLAILPTFTVCILI